MTDESSDLADDIVPEEPKHSAAEREFAPWHKVRKEYVRREQWNKFIKRYAKKYLRNDLQDSSNEDEWSADEPSDIPDSVVISQPLSCLVIPGDDLLDIRSLHRDTEDIHCYIRYLGFNHRHGSEQPNTRVHIAHNDVTSSPRVSNESIVVRDWFQVVAKKNSLAYRYVKRLGPFHVVNLDLCDSLFPNQDGDVQAYFNGLHAIAAYQMKNMAQTWLLFITTEVAPGEVDPEQFGKLCQPTKNNLEHVVFREALSGMVPIESLEPEGIVDLSKLDEKQLIDLFGVAIGKALLTFCSSAGSNWKLEMRGSHIYTINTEKNVWMLSLAFQFTPIVRPPIDATGLSNIKLEAPKLFDEAELATKLVASVGNISNIDEILDSDCSLHQSLLNSSADLLAEAGYDRDAYFQWVEDEDK